MSNTHQTAAVMLVFGITAIATTIAGYWIIYSYAGWQVALGVYFVVGAGPASLSLAKAHIAKAEKK